MKKNINFPVSKIPTFIYFDLFENVHHSFFQQLELVFITMMLWIFQSDKVYKIR